MIRQLANSRALTVREAAALLRVNVKTIYGAIATGRLRVARVGRVIRIPLRAIENGGQ